MPFGRFQPLVIVVAEFVCSEAKRTSHGGEGGGLEAVFMELKIHSLQLL